MMEFLTDQDTLKSWVTAVVLVAGFFVLKRFVLPRLRWFKDLKVIVGWLRLLPHYYRLRDVRGNVTFLEITDSFEASETGLTQLYYDILCIKFLN